MAAGPVLAAGELRPPLLGGRVPDENGWAVCGMICEPASHEDRVTAGSDRVPVRIDRRT
jgi:hypothetical protein